jgi:hypothetical protein
VRRFNEVFSHQQARFLSLKESGQHEFCIQRQRTYPHVKVSISHQSTRILCETQSTKGQNEGMDIKLLPVDYDIDESDNILLSVNGEIVTLDDLVGHLLEPLVFPYGRTSS